MRNPIKLQPPTSVLALLMLLLTIAIHAQSKQPITNANDPFGDAHREARSKNPEGVEFNILLADRNAKFRMGEIIGLELSFSSRHPKSYWLGGLRHDRSGRLHEESFHLDPSDGFVDPLQDYFKFGPSSMGGMSSDDDLGREPEAFHYDLNEWIRFDKPGKYRFFVASPRVYRIPPSVDVKPVPLTLASNIVEFEIVKPDEKWEERQFRHAMRLLERTPEPAHRIACRALRFLGTKSAVRELVRQLGRSDGECGFEATAGLTGSPHRDFVIEELAQQLAEPAQPVTSRYLRLLAELVTLPQFPEFSSGQARQNPNAIWRRWMDATAQATRKYAAQLAASVMRKSSHAKAISLHTLVESAPELVPKSGMAYLTSDFLDLPAEIQRSILSTHWKKVADPGMLPILRQLYEKPPPADWSDVRDYALKRITELSPEEGRRILIAEIKSRKPSLSANILRDLPGQLLPELDNVLAGNLETKTGDQSVAASLIERYASPAILSRVRSVYEEREGKWACHIQDSLLRYILRIDPAAGADLVGRAMQFREDTHCYTGVLRSAGARLRGIEIENLAREFLDDPETDVVIDAVVALGEYGSASAEDTLWRRFESWNRKWAGRLPELLAPDNEAMEKERSLENTFVHGLGHSPAWLTDAGKLDRLKQLCLTERGRRDVESMKVEWAGDIRISYAPDEDGWGGAHIAQYESRSFAAMKEKLSQFPKETVFRWMPTNLGYLDEEEEPVYVEVKAFLEGRGMKLVR